MGSPTWQPATAPPSSGAQLPLASVSFHGPGQPATAPPSSGCTVYIYSGLSADKPEYTPDSAASDCPAQLRRRAGISRPGPPGGGQLARVSESGIRVRDPSQGSESAIRVRDPSQGSESGGGSAVTNTLSSVDWASADPSQRSESAIRVSEAGEGLSLVDWASASN